MADIDSSKKGYKKYFLISAISLIIAAILVISVFLFIIKPKYKEYYDESLAGCLQENSDKYYTMMIQKTGDTSYCSQIKRPKQTDLCSSEKREMTSCDNLPETDKKICQAELQKNPSLCPEKNYFCMALASGDENYCLQIRDPGTKDNCRNLVKLDADAFLSEEAKKTCEDYAYLYAAGMTQNKAVCDKITNPEIRKNCLG